MKKYNVAKVWRQLCNFFKPEIESAVHFSIDESVPLGCSILLFDNPTKQPTSMQSTDNLDRPNEIKIEKMIDYFEKDIDNFAKNVQNNNIQYKNNTLHNKKLYIRKYIVFLEK